ncbi:hypothetical protein GF406_04760 [candidate division KSB1 bacterium]|nr:hypothetical protein [candidate division KSB1 bacterium]
MPIESHIINQVKLNDPVRREMFQLHDRYFANLDKGRFMQDLSEKHWVILLKDTRGALAGFSTVQLIKTNVSGLCTLFIFSGDTIVDQSHRQNSALAGSFGHVMLRVLQEHPQIPIYWYLICKGYRTYRFLPTFFNEFYPHYDRERPKEIENLIHRVSHFKFGNAYDPHAGVIRFREQRDCLRPQYSDIPESRLCDPHVAFFLQKNPQFARGDELACLAAVTRENLNRFAWRVIDHTQVQWHD